MTRPREKFVRRRRSPQPGVFGIAVDATNVYWTTDAPTGSPTFMTDCAVMKMPVAGGATDELRGIAAGTSYVCRGQDIEGASLTGGAAPGFGEPATPFGSVHHGVTADAMGVYTTNDTPVATGGQILKRPVGGGTSIVLVAGQAGPNYITADATNLYGTNLGKVNGVMEDHQGSMMKMPRAGGAVTTQASGLGGAKRIVVDATHVYWNDDVDGVIMKVPIVGGASTTLASGQMGTNGLAVGATYVYWTDSTALTAMKAAK